MISRWLALILAASCACTKSPPEPPSSSSASAASPTTVSAPQTLPPSPAATGAQQARCIHPTPAEAPPAQKPAPSDACPRDPGPMEMTKARVSFPDAPSAPKSIEVELAKTPAQTSRGLMYRRSMPEDHGMLFDLHTRKIQSFWMRNTCIPLDMMFVDEDGTIVGIVEQVPVLNEIERSVSCPSRYVLETNAGFARKHGIKAGQKVTLP